jgi:hypothetical protein
MLKKTSKRAKMTIKISGKNEQKYYLCAPLKNHTINGTLKSK